MKGEVDEHPHFLCTSHSFLSRVPESKSIVHKSCPLCTSMYPPPTSTSTSTLLVVSGEPDRGVKRCKTVQGLNYSIL